jgi:hypothetical protein
MNDDALSADDRLKILELLARADDAASKRDIETYVALFTEDAYLQGIKGVHRHADARTGDVTATSTLLIVAVTHRPSILSIASVVQIMCKSKGDWLIRSRVVEDLSLPKFGSCPEMPRPHTAR